MFLRATTTISAATRNLSENRGRSEGRRFLSHFFGHLRRILSIFNENERGKGPKSLFCSRFSILEQAPRALLAIVLWACAQTGMAAVHALVVGIDKYADSANNLDGAVNDANDIWRALEARGVDSRIKLIDARATRAELTDAWQELLTRAQPGDTLLFTYAGHGSKELANDAPEEEDGMDEVLLLSGFTTSGPGTVERIFDNELFAWFQQAQQKGVGVLFVADACYSGGLSRGINPDFVGTARRKSRYTGYSIEQDQLTNQQKRPLSAMADELPAVTFISAQTEEEQILEYVLPPHSGEARGALSYAFARVLEGGADNNGDGAFTREELFMHLREKVAQYSEEAQEAETLPLKDLSRTVLSFEPKTMSAPAPAPEQIQGLGAIRLMVVNGDVRPPELNQVRMVNAPPFDYQWNVGKRIVLSASGDLVAEGISSAEETRQVMEKWLAVARIKETRGPTLSIDGRPNQAIYCAGRDTIQFHVTTPKGSHLYLFNLASTGEVQLLWPEPGEQSLMTGPYTSPRFQPARPFGADHIVAVNSSNSLQDLLRLIRTYNGVADAGPITDHLLELAKRKEAGIGLFSIYTSADRDMCR